MCKRALNKKGFTLIEIIVSLLLLGVVVAVLGLSTVNMVKSFLFSGKNADTLSKGQIAVARIEKELNNLKQVSASSSNSITFASYRDTATHTLRIDGTNLLLSENGVDFVLTDQVSSFSLKYYDKNFAETKFGTPLQPAWLSTSRIIEVNLVLTGAESIPAAFSVRVAPSFDTSIGP
jgi:prepilin-type N-terminal cleavage/methylation domain-containing protein